MNNTYKKQLQESVIEWLDQGEDYTQAELARKTGVDKAYVSQIKNGKWDKAIPSISVWQKLVHFFGYDFHIDSFNYKSIQGACRRAHEEHIRVGIDGYTGAGKTYALRRYARQFPNVFLVMGDPDATRKDFVTQLADQVGVDPRGSIYKVKVRIIQAIQNRRGKCLLILDEGEYFKTSIWHTVKSLCDELEGKCGVVISGILHELLLKFKNRRHVGFAQLTRRFEFKWLKMQAISKREITQTCKDHGINDHNAIKWFLARVSNYDALSILVKDAIKVAGGRDVTADLLADTFDR